MSWTWTRTSISTSASRISGWLRSAPTRFTKFSRRRSPHGQLMKVEKVPDSTYDMVGGLGKQIREIKEVRCRLCQRNCQLIYMAVRSPLPPSLPPLFLPDPRSSNCPSSTPSFSNPRRSAAQGRPPLWTTLDGQNLACTCRCAPPIAPSSASRVPNWCKSILAGNCFFCPFLERTLSSTHRRRRSPSNIIKLHLRFENGTRTFCYGARGRAVIIFMDEIDSIGSSRTESGEGDSSSANDARASQSAGRA